MAKKLSRSLPAVLGWSNMLNASGSLKMAGTAVSKRFAPIFANVLPGYCAPDVTLVFDANVSWIP
jgi:hypothetical protein